METLKYVDKGNIQTEGEPWVGRCNSLDDITMNGIRIIQTASDQKFRRTVNIKHDEQSVEQRVIALMSAIYGFADRMMFSTDATPISLSCLNVNPITLAFGVTDQTHNTTEIYVLFDHTVLSCNSIDLVDNSNKMIHRYTFVANGETEINHEKNTIPVVYVIKHMTMRLFHNENFSEDPLKFEVSAEKDWIQISKQD
jgi:hypothetical protein